jgi:hypothetical protein
MMSRLPLDLHKLTCLALLTFDCKQKFKDLISSYKTAGYLLIISFCLDTAISALIPQDLKAGSEQVEHAIQTIELPKLDQLKIQPGDEFKQAFSVVDQEFTKASETASIAPFLEYESNVNPKALSLDEVPGANTALTLINIRSNAQQILEHNPQANSIIQEGAEKTEQYQKGIAEAHDHGNYGFFLNGEGPDVTSMAAYISRIKKAPQAIFFRPNREEPKVDVNEFNTALRAMETDEHYGKVKCPTASIINEDKYSAYAQVIRERITSGSSPKPYSLIVFGNGEPIVKLIENHLSELKDHIFVTHIGPYYWSKVKGQIEWGLGYNSLNKLDAEVKIHELKIQRLTIHSGASHLDDFSNIRDFDEAKLYLKAKPDINLNDSGAVKGMAAYLSETSPSSVGQALGKSMGLAAKFNQDKELRDIEIAIEGQAKFSTMNQDELHRQALIETLSVAKQKYLKKYPQLGIQDLTLNSNDEKEVIGFWNKLGSKALEKVTTDFGNWERPRGKILELDQLSNRDLAGFSISQYEKYTGRRYQRELTQTLMAVARRDGQLSHQIHAS